MGALRVGSSLCPRRSTNGEFSSSRQRPQRLWELLRRRTKRPPSRLQWTSLRLRTPRRRRILSLGGGVEFVFERLKFGERLPATHDQRNGRDLPWAAQVAPTTALPPVSST